MSVMRPLSHESTMIEFEGKRKSPLTTVIMSVALVFAAGFMVFFYLSDNSIKVQVISAKSEKSSLEEQLNKPEMGTAYANSLAFRDAVSYLSELNGTREYKADLMTELYTFFTKDVKISNITLSEDGVLGIDGVTGSYRSIADFMMGLKSDPRLSDIKVNNSSLQEGEGIPANEKFIFNISAKFDISKKEVVPVADPEASVSQTSGDSVPAVSGDVVSDSSVSDQTMTVPVSPNDISSDSSNSIDNSIQGY